MRLIRTGAELAALAGRLRSEPLLAVDTEAASFHRYLDRVMTRDMTKLRVDRVFYSPW